MSCRMGPMHSGWPQVLLHDFGLVGACFELSAWVAFLAWICKEALHEITSVLQAISGSISSNSVAHDKHLATSRGF